MLIPFVLSAELACLAMVHKQVAMRLPKLNRLLVADAQVSDRYASSKTRRVGCHTKSGSFVLFAVEKAKCACDPRGVLERNVQSLCEDE